VTFYDKEKGNTVQYNYFKLTSTPPSAGSTASPS
jgi:hypothetical protein